LGHNDVKTTRIYTPFLNVDPLAFAAMHSGCRPVDVAVSLRHEGYKKLDYFRVISGEHEGM
ncbi:MAG: hypothetical protein Q8P24_20020, partial [Desulfobacterales bacterium]|nr:hypothetical protein [Desulfobacterales bacterium]